VCCLDKTSSLVSVIELTVCEKALTLLVLFCLGHCRNRSLGLLLLQRNCQVFREDKLVSKEVECMLELSALTRVCLVVKLVRAVAESYLLPPAMINRFRDGNICRNLC